MTISLQAIEPSLHRLQATRWLSWLLAGIAFVQVAYLVKIGLDPTDVGPFETVLARTVAGHFEANAGPGRFYGPFDGSYPAVLMHAPLYYRLVALAAWPAVLLGFDPLNASLVVGRLLSIFGTLLILWGMGKLANLDRPGSRAGLLAAALLLASPLLGNLAVMLRPDTLGIGLQTCGLGLVLNALQQENKARQIQRICLAAFLFALAFCVKQQNITLAAMAILPAMWAWWHRRVSLSALGAAAAVGMATLAVILGVENLMTGGRMWQTVFVYPSGPFRIINYAGWVQVRSVFDISARRLIGLAALGASCAWVLPRRGRFTYLDGFLAACLGLEILTLVPLCLFNAGAASNYALQAVVLACVIVGRLADRLIENCQKPSLPALPRWKLAPLALTLLFMATSHAYWMMVNERVRGAERMAVQGLLSDPRVQEVAPEDRYFVTTQHLNRILGNPGLIHDDWLYGAFEKATDAEPRASWLRAALTRKPVQQVVTPTDDPRVPGIEPPLTDLGFHLVARHGDLRVWERR